VVLAVALTRPRTIIRAVRRVVRQAAPQGAAAIWTMKSRS